MGDIRKPWQAASRTRDEGDLVQWADVFVKQICDITAEKPDDYLVRTAEKSRGGYCMWMERMGENTVNVIHLSVDMTKAHAEIEEFSMNLRGKGLGRKIALTMISGLNDKLGIRNFSLSAKDMGPGFWPKLGFIANTEDEHDLNGLAQCFRKRLSVLEPYMTKLMAAHIRFELNNFDRTTPRVIAALGYRPITAAIASDPGFRAECRLENGESRDLKTLDVDRRNLNTIVRNASEANAELKLGDMLCFRVRMEMALDLSDPAQSAYFRSVTAMADHAKPVSRQPG